MNAVTKNLTIDLDRQQMRSEIIVQAKQGDDQSREIIIALRSSGVAWEVPSSAALRLRLLKPDGKAVYNNLPQSTDGKVHVTLEGQMLTAAGLARADIEITEGGTLLSSFLFYLDVTACAVPDGTIESTDEFGALQDALDRVDPAVEACEAATDAANSAASSATSKITEMDQLKVTLETAEAARVTAEQGRESAEVARQDAEQQRQTDTASAISAANTAASSANTAADRANKAAEAIEGTDVGDLAVRVQDLEGEMDTVNSKIDGLNVPEMQQDITKLQTELGTAQQNITQLQTDVSGKVDKVSGKGLSTCDYTTAEKEKLAELENYNDSSLRTRISDLESATKVVTGASIVTNGSKTKMLTFRRVGHIAWCHQTLPADNWFDLGTFDGSSSEYTIGTIPSNFVPKINVGIKLSSKGCIVLAESGKIVAMPDDNKLVGTWCSSIYYVD